MNKMPILATGLFVLFTMAACGGGGSSSDSTFRVNTSVGTGGSVSPSSVSVAAGNAVSFSVTPNTGYQINSVSGCGGTLIGTTYTTGAINGNCTVSATFNLNTYTVTATAGSGGSISPTSSTVTHGDTASFTVIPITGYRIDVVTGCSGTLDGDRYTTAPIATGCEVVASFVPDGDPPTANAGETQILVIGETASLDGSASTDPQGQLLDFAWSLLSKPSASSAVLAGANSATPTIVPDVPGEYWIALVVRNGARLSEPDAVLLIACTEFVSGVINGNMRIIESQSPYLMRQTLQVPFGSALLLDAGVDIYGASNTIMVGGSFQVFGTSSNSVILRDVHIEPVSAANDQLFSIQLEHAYMKAGSLYRPTGYAIHGGLTLTDSRLEDLEQYIYLWYPQVESRIERNVFVRSGGISTGTAMADVVIRNNVFYEQRGDYASFPYAVENWAAYTPGGGVRSRTVIELNSFLSTDRVALRLPPGYNNAELNGANNYWGTLNETTINSMIFDSNDDIRSAGTINYVPFLTEPDSATPNLN